MKFYKTIKQFYKLLELRPDIDFYRFEIIYSTPDFNQDILEILKQFYSQLPAFFVYTKSDGICKPEVGLYNVTFTVEELLVGYRIVNLEEWILSEDLEPDEYYVYLKNYSILDIKADIIKTAWKKYRYNIFKKRRDSLKRELTAYVYHPSRLTFEV